MKDILNQLKDMKSDVEKRESKLISDIIDNIRRYEDFEICDDEISHCCLCGDSDIENGYISYIHKIGDNITFTFVNTNDDYETEDCNLYNGSFIYIDSYLQILEFLVSNNYKLKE